MKNLIILIFACFSTLSCSSKSKEFSLIGKWKEIEYHDSNGADSFVKKVENGRIFIFEESNIFKIIDNQLDDVGTYKVNGDSLRITLPNEEFFYRLFHIKDNKLAFNPMTEKFEIICDEGCAYVFEKIE